VSQTRPIFDNADVLDADASRPLAGGASFALSQRLERALFNLCWLLLARWTPPFMRGWRLVLLRWFGADLAPGAIIYGCAKIWYPRYLSMGRLAVLGPRVRCYNQAPVRIDDFAIVSQDSTLCAGTHDYNDPEFQLVTRPIAIGAHAWVAAEAFVGPGVTIGPRAVLGARGVAIRNIPADEVHGGNPARFIRMRAMRDTPQASGPAPIERAGQ
jgi:putative colanic acid biosynthesis acetyltransferase WcaF